MQPLSRGKVFGSRSADGLPAVPGRLRLIYCRCDVISHVRSVPTRAIRPVDWNGALCLLPRRLVHDQLWSNRVRALPRRVNHENYRSFSRIDVRPRAINLQLNGNVGVISLIPKNLFGCFTVAHGTATLFLEDATRVKESLPQSASQQLKLTDTLSSPLWHWRRT
jgi:hypothetical protein